MTKNYDVVIIGGGISGTAIAYELSKYDLKVCLLEKNPYFGSETSSNNSGLIHGGFDAEDIEEARLNVEGNKLWRKVLKNMNIPHKHIRSLVIAFNEEEDLEVQKLYERGIRNKLDKNDIKILNHDEIIKLEPNINKDVSTALLCTSSIAIDPIFAVRAFGALAKKNSVDLYKNSPVTNIEFKNDLYNIQINNKENIQSKIIINAAGHYADRIADMCNEVHIELNTRRGEYIVLEKDQTSKVNSVIFKVPSIHGKGVIVGPMLNGKLLVGPTAEEGVPKEDVSLNTQEKLNYIKNIGHKIIPSLDLNRITNRFAGSRSVYTKTNTFLIDYGNNQSFINVAGIASPGLSSAPAISKKVLKLIKNSSLLKINKKEHYEKTLDTFY